VRTYGVREAGGHEAVTPDTAFRIASLSKTFAATLATVEEKEGKFKFDDKVSPIVPQFHLKTPKDTAAVTIEDLLSHQVGLPPYAFDNLLEAGVAPLEILDRYKTLKPSCPPGQCYAYQNTAFNMITAVIENAEGASYMSTLQKKILDPLALTATSFGSAGLMKSGNWARPHTMTHMTWKAVPVKEPYYKVPAAGGMNSSITDLARWLIAHMGARPDVLSPDVLEELRTSRVKTPAETNRQRILKTPVTSTAYGLGWRRYVYANETLITHSGGVEGYFAQISYLPAKKSGIAILANTRGGRLSKILPTWLDYELGLQKTDWLRLADLQPADLSGSPEDDEPGSVVP
jgi:beta-lactamase class C